MADNALLKTLEEQQEIIKQQSELIVELVETLEQWEQTAHYDAKELKERAAGLWANGGETGTEYGQAETRRWL